MQLAKADGEIKLHAAGYQQCPPPPPPRTCSRQCLQLLIPTGESEYTVYLRAYNSVNNTISYNSTEYKVMSVANLGPSGSLCPENIPSVADDDEILDLPASSSPSPTVVEMSPNASEIPGIIQVRVAWMGRNQVCHVERGVGRGWLICSLFRLCGPTNRFLE